LRHCSTARSRPVTSTTEMLRISSSISIEMATLLGVWARAATSSSRS
jgi:hypothetical protein